jgi:hypothetical protein
LNYIFCTSLAIAETRERERKKERASGNEGGIHLLTAAHSSASIEFYVSEASLSQNKGTKTYYED